VTGQEAPLTIRRAGPADAGFLADMLVEGYRIVDRGDPDSDTMVKDL
jgi:hypothetical protein